MISVGTENVLQIVALGAAAKIALREQMEMFKHLLQLRVRFLTVLRRKFSSAVTHLVVLKCLSSFRTRKCIVTMVFRWLTTRLICRISFLRLAVQVIICSWRSIFQVYRIR